MKRLFVGLTLLLMALLPALDPLRWLQQVAALAGAPGWSLELALAAAAVAAFLAASGVPRRMLFPRRGMRLLAAGIAIDAAGAALAAGLVIRATGMLAVEGQSAWSSLPEVVAGLQPQPLFLAAQLLLVVGAFRALTNLVPPEEFAEDY